MISLLIPAYSVMNLESNDERNNKKLERLFYSFRDIMYLGAVDVMKNHHDADDVVQETFVSIAKIIESVPDETCKTAYVYYFQAARNHARSIKRGLKLHRIFSLESLSEDALVQEDFTDVVVNEEMYNEVLAYVLTLDSKYRDVLTFYILFKMKPSVIATSLRRPLNTVKSQLYRGEAMLRKKFPS